MPPERLLDSRLFEDLTVQDILREAGVSTGSFYARFKTKDDVLRDLYRRYREDLRNLEQGSDSGKHQAHSLAEVIEMIVRRSLKRMEKRRGLIRTIALHMRQHPDSSGPQERKAARRTRDAGVELIMHHRDEITHPRPRDAARLMIFTLAALGSRIRPVQLHPSCQPAKPWPRTVHSRDHSDDGQLSAGRVGKGCCTRRHFRRYGIRVCWLIQG